MSDRTPFFFFFSRDVISVHFVIRTCIFSFELKKKKSLITKSGVTQNFLTYINKKNRSFQGHFFHLKTCNPTTGSYTLRNFDPKFLR